MTDLGSTVLRCLIVSSSMEVLPAGAEGLPGQFWAWSSPQEGLCLDREGMIASIVATAGKVAETYRQSGHPTSSWNT